jgi:predicted nucleic acid-binding Zn ribbon protein
MLGACLSLHEAVRDEEIASSCAEEICDYMRKRVRANTFCWAG